MNVSDFKTEDTYSVRRRKARFILMDSFRKIKSVKKVKKGAHPTPVLHFLFVVYEYIMEHDVLCVTADCGRPRWRIA